MYKRQFVHLMRACVRAYVRIFYWRQSWPWATCSAAASHRANAVWNTDRHGFSWPSRIPSNVGGYLSSSRQGNCFFCYFTGVSEKRSLWYVNNITDITYNHTPITLNSWRLPDREDRPRPIVHVLDRINILNR